MKESRRIKRILRHHKRGKNRTAVLNMVSLMDIFTILVFFLLVTSSDSEVLPNPKAMTLPESSAEKMPGQTLVIMVNDRDIRINDQHIIDVAQVMKDSNSTIPQLKTHLQTHKQQKLAPSTESKAITIMGDREIPYKLLKKIMLTCAGSQFSHISLAVVQKPTTGSL